MLPIKSGRLKKPVKAVFYGLEGTGKSTIAAQTLNPLFFVTEGGTTYLDVNRVDQFPGWESLTSMVEEVARDPDCGISGLCGWQHHRLYFGGRTDSRRNGGAFVYGGLRA